MQVSKLGMALLALGLLGAPAKAQEDGTPVAVISLVWGAVTVKHHTADYKPARWLEPIFPGDYVKTTGAGSKLLITFFNDNHQEVVGEEVEATVAADRLNPQNQGKVRRDKARNPFGAGGVENPFVFTRKLRQADFKPAELPGAYEAEERSLKSAVKSKFPPSFGWPSFPGATSYKLLITAPSLNFTWSKELKVPRYKLTEREAGAITKGAVYHWGVKSGDTTLVGLYPFKCLTLPQDKWLQEESGAFANKRKKKSLQRSDYTDYLLVCSQLLRVDEAFSLCKEMSEMDKQNPRVYRALTRTYLERGCPAHAKEAHETEIKLGGIDQVGL